MRIIFAIIAAMLLVSCGNAVSAPPVTGSDPPVPPVSAALVTASAPEEPPAEAEPLPGFDGYVLSYSELRDRMWEEDVVSAAKMFLKYHPYLTPNDVPVLKTHSGGEFEEGNTANFFRPEMRDRFVCQINELISEIPELGDTEILLRLQRTVAELGDVHSLVKYPYQFYDPDSDADYFPYTYDLFYDGGEPELRAVAVPPDQQELLFAKLISINGVEINDVIDRLSNFISYENTYGRDYTVKTLAAHFSYLRAAGIIGAEETTAEVGFELLDGSVVTKTAEAYTLNGRSALRRTNKSLTQSGELMHKHSSLSFWYEYIPDEDTVYIRINKYENREDQTLEEFFAELAALPEIETAAKVVIDQRDNTGGIVPPLTMYDLIDALNRSSAKVYILFDCGSFSAAVDSSTEFANEIEGAITVGSPAGQPSNFFASAANHGNVMANSRYTYTVSDFYFDVLPDGGSGTLTPEVTVFETLSDYIDGVDTVMEYVRNDTVD